MLAAAGGIDRFDLAAARQVARVRTTTDYAMGEQPVDVAVGIGLNGRREEKKILTPREMPARKGRTQENALKVMRVKVSFTPGSVWISLVTK